jgi:hypothetical protein
VRLLACGGKWRDPDNHTASARTVVVAGGEVAGCGAEAFPVVASAGVLSGLDGGDTGVHDAIVSL